jgi:hypothetical protein
MKTCKFRSCLEWWSSLLQSVTNGLKFTKISFLSLINLSLAHVYYSMILSNHDLIRLDIFVSRINLGVMQWIFVVNLHLIVSKHLMWQYQLQNLEREPERGGREGDGREDEEHLAGLVPPSYLVAPPPILSPHRISWQCSLLFLDLLSSFKKRCCHFWLTGLFFELNLFDLAWHSCKGESMYIFNCFLFK